MAAKVIVVEICERIMKICEIRKRGKSYQIHSAFMVRTPVGAVLDGQLNDIAAVSEALKTALNEKGLTKCSVVFSLISGKIAVRDVTTPPVKENRLDALVKSNAAEYFPIDLSKYHITYSLLGRKEQGDDAGCHLLVYAAPLTLLASYFELAKQCSLSIQAIDYCGNGQYRAVQGIDDDTVTMYVNVGTTNTYVSFMRSGQLLLQRTFAVGGDELISDYMSARKMDDSRYIDAINELSMGLDSPVYGALNSSDISESLNRLISNLVRTSDYFNQSNWEHPVENVVLMGVCSKLVGLREGVSEIKEDIPISYLDELPAMSKLANATESASFYISCIGSLLLPLDLMPESLRADKKKSKGEKQASIVGGVLICVISIIASAGLTVAALLDYSMAAEDHADVQQKIINLEYAEGKYNDYLSFEDCRAQVLAMDAMTGSNNAGLHAFLDELEEKMPSDIILLSASCSETNVILNMTVASKESAALVLVQLRSFETLSDISMSALNEMVDEAGFHYVAFSISCTYGVNPYLPAVDDGAAQQ